MNIRLLILLLLSLTLTACGAETVPEETAAPPQTVQPEEEPPEDVSPDEPEGPASAQELPPLEGTPLTEEELAQANEAFNVYGKPDGGRALEYACFFTSFYEDVTELNLEEFLRYYFNSSEVLDEDAEEFRALAALPGFPWAAEDLERWGNVPSGLPVPVHRIPRAAVDETLETCAGITTADLKNTGWILYLPDYDAYYNFTSDYGPGWFEAAEGARDGDTARLRSEASWWGDGGESVRELTLRELTLREEDGRWLIQSFTRFSAGNG